MNNTKNQLRDVLSPEYTDAFFTDAGTALKSEFNTSGIVVFKNFLSPEALTALQKEAGALKQGAYRSSSSYNLYVLPEDRAQSADSPRNRLFTTTKGCIPDDQIPNDSILRTIYNSSVFKKFICELQNIEKIFPYADSLSSININYYDPADSLEWHFDNADFAITLLLQQCDEGGMYEYFPSIRYNQNEEENYEGLRKALDGESKPETARMNAGDLMLFRGNQSLHRVTPIEKGNRILVTLNYNEKPNISLSEKSRMTFFGRIK